MKVFLSWSGSYTNNIAECFHRWIPCVIQSIETFISSGEIRAGERWQNRINTALQDIDFGVIFVTEANKEKPWIMFEAGALAKNLGTSRVAPVLCGANEIDFAGNPLLQFQYVKLDRDGVYSLMNSLRENLSDNDKKIDDSGFERIFEVWWPSLEEELSYISDEEKTTQPKKGADTTSARLDRIEGAISELIKMNRAKPTYLGRTPSSSKYKAVVASILAGDWAPGDAKAPTRYILDSISNAEEAQRALDFLRNHKSREMREQFEPDFIQRLEYFRNKPAR